MIRKKIKLLAKSCYDNRILSAKRVFDIAKHLKRGYLKKFIKELKIMEAKKNVIVTMPFQNGNEEYFKKLFPTKNIIFQYDSSLLVGVKIEYNNDVYDFNLKSGLEKELSYIRNFYD